METKRPRATRRLRQSLESALPRPERIEPADIAELLGRIAVLAHEVRFLIYTILLRHEGALPCADIASLARQRASSVLRNLHLLITERLVAVEEDASGVRLFTVDRTEAAKLAAFFGGDVEAQTENAGSRPGPPMFTQGTEGPEGA